jgi:hypothetical protein
VVQENGTFSYTVEMVDPLGEVTSIVEDTDHLWSAREMVYI